MDNTLGIRRTANVIWEGTDGFDFQIVPSPQELEAPIRQKSAEGFTSSRDFSHSDCLCGEVTANGSGFGAGADECREGADFGGRGPALCTRAARGLSVVCSGSWVRLTAPRR